MGRERDPAGAYGQGMEQVLDWISDGCLVLDRALRCTYANPAMGALLGLPPAELVGRRLAELSSPAAASLHHLAERALADQVPARREFYAGSLERWYELRAYPSSAGLLALAADVTGRRQAEAARAERLEELRMLVEQVPAFLWITDRELRLRRIEGASQLLGAIGRDRLIGLDVEQVTRFGVARPEEIALTMDMHRRALHGRAGCYRATWKGITLETRVQPLLDPAGGIAGVVGVGLDVTEQARTQERLRESEERFRALVEHGTDLIGILDEQSRLRYASPSYTRMLGYEPAELEMLDMWTLVHPDDTAFVREQFARMDRHRVLHLPRPVRIRTKDGGWRSLVYSLTDLRQDPAVRGVVVNGRDVTELQALETRLRQAQKMEALGQLAGGVAHDFNNILAAIAGYAQLVHDDLAPGEQSREDLAEVIGAAERAAGITRQLLAFSRRQASVPARVDLVALVQGMGRLLRALLPAGIALRISPPAEAEPLWVAADRTQLEQVILNLAVNARDAMPQGGELEIAARPGTSAPGAAVAVLEVRDEGVGMSPEVRERAFEPFFTTKEPGRGTGLGLATVYGIVRQFQGSIEIASAPGEGTTFTVRLPLAEEGAPAAERSRGLPERRSGGRVLVVEDEQALRDVFARVLRRAGYEVLAAGDGAEALELLAAPGGIDLVLSDATMPGIPGQDLAEEIGRRHPGVPVILMSGYGDPSEGESPRPLPASVAAFVQKPFLVSQLLGEVHRVLAGEPPPDEPPPEPPPDAHD